MHATFDQLSHADLAAPLLRSRHRDAAQSQAEDWQTAGEPAPADRPAPGWQHGGGYGGGRVRPGTVAAILLFHAALFGALVQFDVIEVHKKSNPPLVVTLMPEPVAPPPAAPPPEQEVKPIRKVETPIVSTPPLVTVPVAAAAPVVTVAEPPPPQATVAAPAPASPTVAPAPPITPPDASAASLKNAAPRYPTESRRLREEGTVRLRVVITTDGRVKEIGVARSSGFDRLDKAALETVRKWKFKPGMQGGMPVEAVGFLNIPFKIAAA